MDASIVVSLRIGSARNLRPTGNREVSRVGHGGRGYGPPGAGRCQWASCGLSLLRCPAPASWPARLPSRQGSLWRERPPAGEGRWCDHSGAPPPPARWRTSAEKQGVAPSTSTPLVRRAGAPGGRGTREAQPRIASSQRTRKMLVLPRLMRRFVKVSNHNGKRSAL